MYSKLPNLVIGFHGCDVEVYNRVIRDESPMKKSEAKNAFSQLLHLLQPALFPDHCAA